MRNVASEMDEYCMVPIDGSAGSDMAWKFFGLGNLTGKTATEIIASVGMPSFTSSIGEGLTLLQWEATGYAMALVFNVDGRALKVAHESAEFAVRH